MREEIVRVGLGRPSRRPDLADLVVRGAAELLSLEVLLDLLHALGGRLDSRRLKELDLHDLGIESARAYVHPGPETLALEEVSVDCRRHDVEVGDIDSGGRDPRDDRALEQPARRGAVAARDDPDAALEGSPEGDSDAKGSLRREIDVDEAGDGVAPEQAGGQP